MLGLLSLLIMPDRSKLKNISELFSSFRCFLFVFFRGKLTVFTVLCEQYQPSLKRDPMYNEVSVELQLLLFVFAQNVCNK